MPLDDRELFARLVAFDTTSHASNLPLADFLAEYLDRPGVRIDAEPLRRRRARPTSWSRVGPEAEDRERAACSPATWTSCPRRGAGLALAIPSR